MEAFEILTKAANALNEKKAKEINAVKIGDLTVLAEYFLMCTATSSTHVRALCDEVEEKLEEAGVKPHHIEGRTTGWIVLDYGSVIVHIFSRNDREFYGLDKMWSDGEAVDMSEILTGSEEENTDEN
ncbi:MAG: ribosome silencing factor [Clostridia bacterium]|nr:ribosome silencing factor [Clostridia bacterium]MEE1055019.1 ribosome silencing factor [Acutalibacteraceae bacterium]